MPLADSKHGSGRYIVRSEDSKQLSEFIKNTEGDDCMKLLDVIGPAEQPHTAVIEMPHEKAHSLEEQFRNAKTRLIIEPDRPLSLFDGVKNE
ncbi:MAG TPA: hypothetical protein VEC06_14750 [Paucimonas sp.]|nr:hypothetical protein [Paucimonas sp.]